MNTILPPALGDKVSFKDEKHGYTVVGRVNNVIDGKVVIAVRRSRNSFGGGIYKVAIEKVTVEQRKGQVDPRQHSDKGLETLTGMNTIPADWGLTAIKWELRKMIAEVWVLCPLCAGGGQIGTLKGKTVPSHEAWNAHDDKARESIRTCTKCPQRPFTRKGREWYREDEDGVWRGTGGGHSGAAHSNSYSFMNGLVLAEVTVEREVGIVQWAKNTQFDSRFGGGHHCSLCSKDIPSGQFAPVTGKGADGVIHGMWVGMDCARKFFGIKNFKENQIVERPKEAK